MRWERRRRAIVPSSPCPAEVSFILERRKLGLDIKSCGRWQRKSVRFYWDNQVSRRVNPSLSRAIGPPRKPRRWRRLRWKSWTTPSEATRGPSARCSDGRHTAHVRGVGDAGSPCSCRQLDRARNRFELTCRSSAHCLRALTFARVDMSERHILMQRNWPASKL